jgi:hypothetical protein
MAIESHDKRVARNLSAYFIDEEMRELIQIEYRYEPGVGFDLYTQIQNKIYQFKASRFFYILSDLLDQLPATSSLVIPHQIIGVDNEENETVITVEEKLYPFIEQDRQTVIYQLKVSINGLVIETSKNYSFDTVADEIRKELEGKYRLKMCAFCKYLLQENYDGGTDYRHDQLYCFRDYPDLLDELLLMSVRSRWHSSLLSKAMSDVDAFHSCSAFTDTDPRE